MSEQTNERAFSYLYFKAKQANGVSVPGKFETLKVRFLYSDVSQIPMGRVHLYSYAPKKFTRVMCLKNGVGNKDLDKHECPMCATEKYGTPTNKYYAFVSDLNDEGALKLLELNWSLGKQISEIAEIKGVPLHNLVFTLSKRGQGKDTTYTPLLEGADTFDVNQYMALLGLKGYPSIVGPVEDKPSIMQLSKEQMVDFIGGQYPWSTGDGSERQERKFTVLGSTVTVRNTQADVDMADTAEDLTIFEDDDDMVDVDDTPTAGSFF